jgi:hypothetical protein
MQDDHHFIVARVDRRGELPPSYLQRFAVAGRNGLRQLAFGPAETAHPFEQKAEAEDIARRLRRRVSWSGYDFVVEEAPAMAAALPAAG